MKNSKKVIIVVFILLLIGITLFYKCRDYDKEKVIISKDSFATAKGEITINMKTKKGYRIYYTLDGSVPSKKSIKYKKPIKLNRYSSPDQLVLKDNIKLMIHTGIAIDDNIPRGTVLRAAAIAPNGEVGPIETRTYFIGTDIADYYNKIAVISLVTDPKNLLDYKTGIFVKGEIYDKWVKTKDGIKTLSEGKKHEIEGNYTQKGKDWEREATIEMFDGINTSSFKEDVGIRLKGSQSRFYSQKSFNIYFREDYGNKKLKYELFQDAKDIDGKVINEYKRFTIRNGGNDTNYTKFKDQMLQDLVKDRKVDTQSGRVAIVFINGEYWGIYDLQEKYSDSYYAEHYKIDKDNVVVIKESEVEEGKEEDIKLYNELMEYANKDLSDWNTYNEFKEKVDIDSMIDYFAIEIYIGNGDWGEEKGKLKNTQLWRVRKPDGSLYGDGKWRWSLYDLEYSSGLYEQEITNVRYNTLDMALNRQPLFKSAMNNSEFRQKFYDTLREIGSNNYSKDRVETAINNYDNLWKPYMLDYYRRFGSNEFERDKSITDMNNYFAERYNIITNY